MTQQKINLTQINADAGDDGNVIVVTPSGLAYASPDTLQGINIDISNDDSATIHYPVFVTGVGNQTAKISNSGNTLAFQPSTGDLSFAGTLTGGSVPWARLTDVPSTFAPSAHTHPLSDLSGIGGTPSASTYLRGDGVWATPAGGTFIGLSDTPSAYTAAAGRALAVNGTGNGVEFTPVLDLDGDTAPASLTLRSTGLAADAFFRMALDGGDEALLWADEADIVLVTNGIERMRVGTAGSVGINALPEHTLDIGGTLRTTGAATFNRVVAGTASATNGSRVLSAAFGAEFLPTIGTNRSSGGWVLGYGVWPSLSVIDEFVSGVSSALPRSALTIDTDLVWRTADSVTSALDTPVTMTERMRVSAAGALGITTIELGHASDTTLSRIAAGRVAIAGGEIAKLNGTQPFTTAQTFGAAVISATQYGYQYYNPGAGVDNKRWSWDLSATTLSLLAVNDAFNNAAPAFTVERSGFNISNVYLHAAGEQQIFTQSRSTAPNTTGAKVRHSDGNFHDIGLNVMPPQTINAAVTFARTHVGKTLVKDEATARTWSTPGSSDTTIPVGSTINLMNLGTNAITVAAGSGVTLSRINGTGAAATGSRTLAQGGIATLWKRSATSWVIWGNAGLS